MGPPPSPGSLDRLARRRLDRKHVRPVDAHARHPVGDGALGDRRDRELELVRRGVGVQVVVDDPHDGELRDGRHVERLVPPPVRGGAVPADRQRDVWLASPLVREGRSARHRVRDRQVRHDGPGLVPVPVADVAVAVAAARVAVDPAPELGHDPLQVEALRDLRREVAVRREERVIGSEGEHDPDMRPFLPTAGVDGSGEATLPIQRLHPLVEVAAELQQVQGPLQLVVGEPRRGVLVLAGLGGRHGLLRRCAAACRRARGAPRRSPRTGTGAGGSRRRPRRGRPPSS